MGMRKLGTGLQELSQYPIRRLINHLGTCVKLTNRWTLQLA